MEPDSLTSLPDDLLLDIVEFLDTARDVSRLSHTAKRTYSVIQQNGWKTFVKTRFPSLTVPSHGEVSWAAVANRLTYLDRCWDRRGIQLRLFKAKPPPRRKGRGYRVQKQGIDFHGIVDAHYTPSQNQETVVWGGGEDLHIGWGDAWGSVLGRDADYSAGSGDVTALKILERQGAAAPEVVVGRANGDVQFLSTAPDKGFGKVTTSTVKLDGRGDADQSPLSGISPGRLAVTCIDWQPEAHALVASRSSHLHLFNMSPSESNPYHTEQLVHQDVSHGRPADEECFIRDTKFLDKEHIAVALGGSRVPLLYGTIRPTGVEFAPACRNPDTCIRTEGRLEPITEIHKKTNIWAIQPLLGGQNDNNNNNLLLSSWQDGTFRLMDMRTPSPYDAIYRDNFQPYHPGGPLLVYGTERFITGNNFAPTLRFFDFRFDKPYFHTTALACSAARPEPLVPCSSWVDTTTGLSQCTPGQKQRCSWHTLSVSECYRPDATFWLGDRGLDRVFSLAKASDTSDRFYCGLRGAIAEAQLVLDKDASRSRQVVTACPEGWQVVRSLPPVTMAETGTSLCTSAVHNAPHGDKHRGMPELLCQVGTCGQEDRLVLEAPERSRLDTALRQQVPMRRNGVRGA